jgi:hypothetical protein
VFARLVEAFPRGADFITRTIAAAADAGDLDLLQAFAPAAVAAFVAYEGWRERRGRDIEYGEGPMAPGEPLVKLFLDHGADKEFLLIEVMAPSPTDPGLGS